MVCRSVCLSVRVVSCAKTAVPIEMAFGLRIWGLQAILGRTTLRGRAAQCKVQGHSAVSCAKAAEPIEMRVGCGLGWTQVSIY